MAQPASSVATRRNRISFIIVGAQFRGIGLKWTSLEWNSGDRGQRSEVRSQRSEVGGQKSEVRTKRAALESGSRRVIWIDVSVPMLPVEPTMKVRVVPGTIVNRRPPMATGPDPVIIAPSPASTDPDIPRRRADWRGLDDRSRHWRGHDDRGRSYHHGRRNHNRGRNSEVDTDMNPGACSGNSQSGQGQNCDCLFHNVCRFDAVGEPSIVTNRLPICNYWGTRPAIVVEANTSWAE